MTQYFQKARELGEYILNSEQAQTLAEANLSGLNIQEAQYNYDALVSQVINMLKATVYEDEEAASPLLNAGNCGGCKQTRECKGS
jgi:hypothetical protein